VLVFQTLFFVFLAVAAGAPAADYLPGSRVFAAAPAVPAAIAVKYVNDDDQKEGYDPHPRYQFGYAVADTLSGDSKAREETRDGDLVTGSYTVADPDGRIRTVTYTADPVHGFQARVTYDGAPGPVAIPVKEAVAAADGAPAAAASFVDTADAAITVARAPVDDAASATALAASPANRNRAEVIRPVSFARPAAALPFFQAAPAPHLIRQVFSPPPVPAAPGLSPLDFSPFRVVPTASNSPVQFLPPHGVAFRAAPNGLDFSQLRFVSAGNVV
jgi:hypothetical protein